MTSNTRSPQEIINQAKASKPAREQLAQMAVELAAALLDEANRRISPADKVQGEKMARMMQDPEGKAFTLALADQAFRSHVNSRAANQFKYLVDSYGIPAYLST